MSLERLTGVRTSKPGFYPEYRRTSAGLDRAIHALESISTALCMTTRGPAALAHAVVEALAGEFGATWTAAALRPESFPAPLPALVARSADGTHTHAPAELPPGVAALLAAVLDGADAGSPTVEDAGRLAVPMLRGAERVGALLVWLPPGDRVDDSDAAIIRGLASQTAVALENACRYEQAERHAAELERRGEQLAWVQGRLAQARERELVAADRDRIARELHDGVAQHLLGIGMHLEWCRRAGDAAPAVSGVDERLALAKDLARAAVDRIRSAIYELSAFDGDPSGGLPAALAELAADVGRAADLDVAVRVRHGWPRQPAAVEHALYRVAQEAVSNVVRHAGASRAAIALGGGSGRLHLTVTDDGGGEPQALRRRLREEERAPSASPHRGLAHMARRAREAGGTLHVTRARGGGVRIRVSVPAGDPLDAPGGRP